MKNSRKKTTECKQKKLNHYNIEQQYPDVDDVIGELDVYLFHEGKHYFAYQFMGAHACMYQGVKGVRFTTWAPNATSICVIGDFSDWKTQPQYYMERISEQGLWSVFVAHLQDGVKYKFVVENGHIYSLVYKCDPYAFYSELRPQTASIVYTHQAHVWNDREWMDKRKTFQAKQAPINIYELHLASWKKNWSGGFVSYYELCDLLPSYLLEMGYTHVEIMPLHEHPLDKSWGYQATSYFSATSRHGDLQGLKQLIDVLHQANIGVILDWVAGHFGKDEHGLINFDGGATYEYQDYWRANNVGWGAHNFDLGRNEVKSFLISNAMYWLQEFHIDGLRMDAVSNVLYLSYDREEGEWQPNIYGGNQNLQAIDFLKEFNYAVHQHFPGIMTIAEESTAWAGVTNSVENGGLGFDFKWNMGWMNDTLSYLPLDPIYRKYHHNQINFSMIYQYSEHFILSISHDEVVHGKGSLISKMWGDIWNKHASLRLYMLYQMGHPGKKLIFMGTEFGQFTEWQEAYQLPWEIIGQYQTHAQTHYFFKQLNHFYRAHPALWEMDSDPQGFEWIDANNSEQSILSFIRYNADRSEMLVFVCNFTPVRYENYRIGVPIAGNYQQIFNSDNPDFGGTGHSDMNDINSDNYGCHSFAHSLCITVPSMAGVVFQFIR